MPRICLLVLCGMPASGKTTFAKSFTMNKQLLFEQKWNGLHICYDHLLPSYLEEQLISSHRIRDDSMSEWKFYRLMILKHIDELINKILIYKKNDLMSKDYSNFSQFLCSMQNNSINEITPLRSDIVSKSNTALVLNNLFKLNIESENDTKLFSSMTSLSDPISGTNTLSCVNIVPPGTTNNLLGSNNLLRSNNLPGSYNVSLDSYSDLKSTGAPWSAIRSGFLKELQVSFHEMVRDQLAKATSDNALVLLIDDNMRLKSMRYNVYQITKKYRISYAQIYFPVELNTALECNSLRDIDKRVDSSIIKNMFCTIEPPSLQNNAWEKNSIIYDSKNSASALMSIIELIHTSLNNPSISSISTVEKEHHKELSQLACLQSIIHQSDLVMRKHISKLMIKFKEEIKSKKELSAQVQKLNTHRNKLLQDIKRNKICMPILTIEDIEIEGNILKIYIDELFKDYIN